MGIELTDDEHLRALAALEAVVTTNDDALAVFVLTTPACGNCGRGLGTGGGGGLRSAKSRNPPTRPGSARSPQAAISCLRAPARVCAEDRPVRPAALEGGGAPLG